ncbi:MAG: peptide chain release factor N(5)-glutamine methyltransferase [Desulfurivibrionaceae bacterium]|nr:peptide chain release factor N(5)-glutamine methyltransferase [Desulfurivibrionaceae bacterium]
MKTRELYNRTVGRFHREGIVEAATEAELLLRYFLDLDRVGLFLDQQQLTDAELEKFEKLVRRRLAREPLSYIVGEQEFWSLSFEVAADVLIPRPETELLIENVLELIEAPHDFTGRILDLGTGSGIIAVVLALELPLAEVVAVDRSEQALAVAARNLKRYGVTDRVALVKGDWFSPLRPALKFDFIVSNPPYVSDRLRSSLQPELKFEPESALYAGVDGMAAYRRIIPSSRPYLKSNGYLLLEIGYDQETKIQDLFKDLAGLQLVGIRKDYNDLPRVASAKVIDAMPDGR